jgi:DNA-directed RNA polymerase specialized sigma24 family protein
MLTTEPVTICSHEMGQVYLRVIRHTLRRWRGHPMADDLVAYAALRVCETLARLRTGSAEEAFGVVALIARLAARNFWRSQHCDAAWRPGAADREVPLSSSEGDDEWLRRFVVPDFAPALIERLWATAVWRELEPLLTTREREVVCRWLQGERLADIARSLGLAHQSTTWRLQAALDRYRRRHGLPCRRLSC